MVLGTYDYPTSHRVFEFISVGAFVFFAAAIGRRVVVEIADRFSPPIALLIVVLLLAAYALADLLSGIVHFLLDNFGSPATPVIGQKFVKPFRDHHVDPMEMTRGDFIAVNADNVFACLPVLIPVFFFLDVGEHPYIGVFLVGLVAGVIMTNQLHKWAHMPTVPRLVAAAQRKGVVLSKEHHAVHHSGHYDRNYCITWGYLDVMLNRFVLLRKRA
ncbi:MAG TPA: fatty acid desaturase CarF family protein [Ilumatobacteraceae bacterium]|jgi:ubiquitin-conjugating enzyme E2 variant|nr:fatty acid desaturase CarF family protein [Ilumatobacteraceae bacterium]